MTAHACCAPQHGRTADDPLAPTTRPGTRRSSPDLLDIAAAGVLMGSEDALTYPQDLEGPVREVDVDAFAIAATAVTNAEFARFVADTGHVSTAERFGDSLVFAGLLPPDSGPWPAVAATPWWRSVQGASWSSPEGPGSDVVGREDHPVVHVSHDDAVAYCAWAGGRLPTEPEWELAARGGLVQQPFPWGDELEPGGVPAMNVWQGRFPDGPAGRVGTVPVRSHAPNGLGLFNTTGNVWEWTSGRFAPGDPRPVARGGSYLCHESYCRRYRTSARTASTADTTLGHTGFRLAA